MILIIFGIVIISLFISAKLLGYAVYTSTDSCQDSDLGDNSAIKGTIKGTYYPITNLLQPKQFSETDYCENSKVLREYYCTEIDSINIKKSEKKYECLDSCREGICIGGIKSEVKFSLSKWLIVIEIVLLGVIFYLFKKIKLKKQRKNSKK